MIPKTRRRAATGALALALLVAGCSNGTDEEGTSTEPTATAPTEETTSPSEAEVDSAHNDADTMFAQMMIVHHEGAIEMSELAVERADSDEVRSLAEGISAAQGPEIEQMTSWLEAWGEDTQTDMGGMGHSGMDMEGMSQEEAMGELGDLSGADFDTRFLELMTAHHQGAIEMAEAELADGENPQALDLAEQIIADQEAEIEQMEQMLQDL